MNLLVWGCNFRDASVEIREKFSLSGNKLNEALDWFNAHETIEAVILATCNRVEIYMAEFQVRPEIFQEMLGKFCQEFIGVTDPEILGKFQIKDGAQGVRHLFRVAASLDSMILGEGQISGQVKTAFEAACARASAGPILHALFRQARKVAKRVRTETGISRGHVSVSSVAVDYVRQVFDHFGDKTVAILGAGKMGELTLRHLQSLRPKNILVSNRSFDKARDLASVCGGKAVPWENLDDLLVESDIVISSTGAQEPIVAAGRFQKLLPARLGRPLVILDIAVPRDFDPGIHDGDQVCLFNIDDLQKIRESTLRDRLRHVPKAEEIVDQETKAFLKDIARRRNGPVIARLNQELENKRLAVVANLLARLNGKLTPQEKEYVEGAFRLLQNQFLHGPISALADDMMEERHSSHSLLDALRKLFRLHD